MASQGPIVFDPKTAQAHTHTAIFLHGRGDTAPNFVRSLDYFSRTSDGVRLQDRFPTFRWVFPRATMRPSVAHRGGLVSQWFDVRDVRDFSLQEELQAVGLRESVTQIRQLIVTEVENLGGRWDRLVLMGISQGAATSVHTLFNLSLNTMLCQMPLRGERRLAAFIGFSCRMPFPGRSLLEMRQILNLEHMPDDDELLRNTPMLLEHCTDDPLVLVEHGKVLRETLRGFGAQVTWKEYPTGGHWFKSPEGMDDVVQFLNSHVLTQVVSDGADVRPQPPVSSSAMDMS